MCVICDFSLQYGSKIGFKELTTFCSVCNNSGDVVISPWHGVYIADMIWDGKVHHILEYIDPKSFICNNCGKESFHIFYPCDSDDNSFRLFAENISTSK